MKLKEISYTRKYNLGNYETEDLSITAELYEQDSPKTVWTELANIADDWHLQHVREKKAAQSTEATPTINAGRLPPTEPQRVQPLQQPVKSPMQQANENSYPTKLSPAAQAVHDLGTLPPAIRERLTVNEGKIYIEYTKDKKPWIDTMNALRPLGYEWISDGNNSHWRLKQ